MANAYVRMRHPDYDALRGMLDDVGPHRARARRTERRRDRVDHAARAAAAADAGPGPASLDVDGPVADGHRRLAGARARRRRARRAARRPRRQPALYARWLDVLRARPGVRRGRARAPARCSTSCRSSTCPARPCAAGAMYAVAARTDGARARAARRRSADASRRRAAARRDGTWPGSAQLHDDVLRRPGAPEERRRDRRAPRRGRASSWRAPACLVVAGGHVGVLLRVLHLFDVSPHVPAAGGRLVGRGDGADRPGGALPRPGGAGRRRRPRSSTRGSGWSPALVLLPHARRRLRDRRRRSGWRCWPAGSRRPAAWSSTTASGSTSVPTARCRRTRGSSAPTGGSPRGRRHDRGPAATAPGGSRSTGSRTAKPLDAAAVDRFLARHEVPIVEGDRCTFLWRGEADEVRLVPADRRAARPDPAAPAARHRPVVPGARAARGLAGRVPDRDPARRARTSGSTTRSTRSGRTARSARRRSASRPATRRRTGRCPDPDARPGELQRARACRSRALRPRRAR